MIYNAGRVEGRINGRRVREVAANDQARERERQALARIRADGERASGLVVTPAVLTADAAKAWGDALCDRLWQVAQAEHAAFGANDMARFRVLSEQENRLLSQSEDKQQHAGGDETGSDLVAV